MRKFAITLLLWPLFAASQPQKRVINTSSWTGDTEGVSGYSESTIIGYRSLANPSLWIPVQRTFWGNAKIQTDTLITTDTIPAIFLMCDTAEYERIGDAMFTKPTALPGVHWIKGYIIDYTGVCLDENKKPLSKNILVWDVRRTRTPNISRTFHQ